MLDCQLYGLNPAGHHLTSVLFHIANTLLLFGLLRHVTGAVWRSAFVAALFALHPMHVESVAWIAERKDVLSTFFGLLTLLAWCSYVRTSSRRYYALALLLFALGLMSKPMLVTLPLLMLLLDYWPLRRFQLEKPWRQYLPLVTEKLPFFVLTAIFCVVTFIVVKAVGDVVPTGLISPAQRVAGALVAYARYLGKLFWPQNMTVFYPYSTHLPWWQVTGAALLLAIISIISLLSATRRPWLIVGWLWFMISLVPVIGLVQVGGQAIADRYTYLSAVGLFVMVAWDCADRFAHWPGARPALVTAAALTLMGCILVSMRQLQYWRDSITLFSHAIDVTTGNLVAYNDLGQALAESGKLEPARLEYATALQIDPAYAEALDNLGSVLEQEGKFDEAISNLDAALKVRPNYDQAHYNLALAYSGQGKTAQAIAEYRATIKLNPGYDKALANLGLILAQQGNLTEAISLYQQAIHIAPDNAYAHNALAFALASQGDANGALQHYSDALQIKPDLEEAHENLAVLLAEHGRFDDARPHFQTALKLHPNDPGLRLEFANALLAAGDLNSAASQYSNALVLQPDYLAAHYNLAGVLTRQKHWDAALAQYSEALRLKPDLADAHAGIAFVMVQQGNERGAIEHYRVALRLNPNLAVIQKNLVWLLATGADASLRDSHEAVQLATEATRLASTDAAAWDALATAQAEAGNFTDAVTAANKALQLANTSHQTELAAQIQDRLKLYQTGQPFHAGPQPPQITNPPRSIVR